MNYAADLAAGWEKAKAPRAKDAPTVVSLFAGCGGSSLGYAMAGFDERLAVEWDDHAAATFRANFPSVDLFHGDVAKLSGAEALERARVREGELDVLDGSPPCQGFSTVGNRRTVKDDPRNQLFKQYVRLLRTFKPKALVMENVSGMIKGRMKLIFNEILAEIKDSGYKLAVRLLNASWYGVPQSRDRVIFVGFREDLGLDPQHPAPTSREPTTVREAFEGIDYCGPALRGRMRTAWSVTRPGESYAEAFGRLGARESYFSVYKLAWNSPSPTVVKTVSPGFNGFALPDRPFSPSIAAVKRLGSFPDAFEIPGKYEDQWARVGNSVPPMMMYRVAQKVSEVLRCSRK